MTEAAVLVLDPGGRVRSSNAAAGRMYGLGVGGISGRHLGTFYAEAELAREHLRLAGEDGAWAGEVERRRDDGHRFVAEVEITAQRSAGGELLGYTEVARGEIGIADGAAEARFLAKASGILSSSLDYQETLSQVARLVVPRLADWCVVDMVGADGGLVNVATAHKDPEKVALARRMRERYPPDPDAPIGAMEVVRTGRPQLAPEIPPDLMATVARDEEHLRLLRALDLSSYMVVPLAARGRMLGAISLVGASGRRLGERELELVRDLAADAALAVDNARLYEEAQREISERARAEEALKGAERRYRALVEQMPAVTYIEKLDEGERKTDLPYVSPQIEDLFGYTPEEWTSDPDLFVRLLHPDDRERVLAEDERTELTGENFTVEYRQYTRDGRLLWVRDDAALVRDEGGRPLFWQGVILDITDQKRAQEALRMSEASLRAAQAMASIGDWEYDLDRNTSRWSEELFRIFGLPTDETPDFRGFFDLVHPDDRGAVRREVFATLRAGEESSMDYRIRRPDGEVRSVHTGYRVVRDGAGRAVGMVGTIQDITERKRFEDALMASERRFRQLFENSGDALIVHDESSRVVDCNREACRSLGYTREEMLHLKVGDFAMDMLSEEEREAMGDDTFWKRAMRAEPGEIVGLHENTHRRKDGTTFPVEVGIGSIEYGGRRLVFAAARDITERKRAEDELAQRMEELRRSNAELELFAYVASHDLQEPLRMVSSFTQLLRRRYEGQLDATADEFIGYAVDGANRMQALINALLEYSRVGTRGRPLAAVDTATVFRTALSNLRNAVSESGAEVVAGDLPTVLGDEVQLMQLFQNLISNAIKFRGEEPPRVRVEARRRGRDWVFTVRDNGIGISPEYRERIFVIFQRLHGREEYSGTGIGLALCKKIVERHGGRIWAESEQGQGSSFFFTLRPAG